MATTIEELETAIQGAIAAGFRGRLLDQGEARAMIWREGQLPPGSPQFSAALSYDLYSYAYSLLSMGLRLRDGGGDGDIARNAFERAAVSLESILVNNDLNDEARSFHFVVAAAAYHLARYSARAYSILKHGENAAAYSPIERCLTNLMLRDFAALEREVISYRIDGDGTDANISAALQENWDAGQTQESLPENDGNSFVCDALGAALIDTFLAGMGLFLFALERGEREFVDAALERLRVGLGVCAEINLLPQWWAFRLAIQILDDLWSSSFHERLPLLPNSPNEVEWARLRRLFISLLFRRPRAEVDLWPSQLDAAQRATNLNESLVVSLPTSAGKTRIAELCILRCLAAGRRIVFVTPLRALSAQTETSLQRTFIPLGKSISTLYGSIGTSEFEENALGSKSIIVATPEKLDFALRNNPELLNDVGLIVLDEGHMIGLGEREVRYEVQIQRLLKRADAHTRRIVCLSAILPEGAQLDDFVAWLRQDGEGSLVKNPWRPTRLRFGEISWFTNRARLDIRVGNESPFVPAFFTARQPQGRRRKAFPTNHREFVLATAWRLADDGQTVLIYCPERRSVEPYAKAVVALHRQGLLASLLGGAVDKVSVALAIGREWLGEDHPILQCLSLGVAVHHGALPTPFRKEVESLLRDGVLTITISSPTLAQGLNLSATAIVLHGIIRNREIVKASEFRNVVGRAGRAFVDVEGLVLLPFFERDAQRKAQWNQLVSEDGGREMESGLLRLAATFIVRIRNRFNASWDQVAEYILNNTAAWAFPPIAGETGEQQAAQQEQWQQHLATLDTALLSLMGEHEVPDDQVALRLDQLLHSSLWQKRLARYDDDIQRALNGVLHGRTRFLWGNSTPVQRRSYFLAGVGYETGRQLDAISQQANLLLVQANAAIVEREQEAAIAALTALAELIFPISPFTPDPFPQNWQAILRAWMLGTPLAQLGQASDDVLRFVENGLIYVLPWGMEAIRVRGVASADTIGDDFAMPFALYETGAAVPAVETGTLNRAAALLMQAGFNSRTAAIRAVVETDATFDSAQGLRDWLRSDAVIARSQGPNWPTAETVQIWQAFVSSFEPPDRAVWKDWSYSDVVHWRAPNLIPIAGSPVRIVRAADGQHRLVVSPDHTLLGTLAHPLNPTARGLIKASVADNRQQLTITYVGPSDLTIGQLP
jgi:hypothetical protein